MYTKGSVHGRFQPAHLDHLEYMLAAARKCEHLIIGITQPNISHLADCPEDPHRAERTSNPLSFKERCEAIKRMLIASGIEQESFSFSRFPIETPELLEQHIPKSVICFTTIRDDWNLTKVERLEALGYSVEVLWDRRGTMGLQGTTIRNSMISGDSVWKNHLHPAVSEYLEEIELAQRLINVKNSL